MIINMLEEPFGQIGATQAMFFAPLKILDSKKTNSSITIRVVAQSKAHEKFTEVKKLIVAK